MHRLRARLPDWALEWLDVLVPLFQILLILLLAYVLYRFVKRLVRRMALRYNWPIELTVPLTSTVRWIIIAATTLAVLERLGVSATVLWTGFSSFAAVGAVAFFAAWSVLSNFFCALLIFTVRPFRLGDYIEVLDTADKPGAKGRVVDINLLYTTLEDHGAAVGHTAGAKRAGPWSGRMGVSAPAGGASKDSTVSALMQRLAARVARALDGWGDMQAPQTNQGLELHESAQTGRRGQMARMKMKRQVTTLTLVAGRRWRVGGPRADASATNHIVIPCRYEKRS